MTSPDLTRWVRRPHLVDDIGSGAVAQPARFAGAADRHHLSELPDPDRTTSLCWLEQVFPSGPATPQREPVANVYHAIARQLRV
jgi:hypothetical protein